MGKKYRDRWDEYAPDGTRRQRQRVYDSKAEMEKGRAKRLLGEAPQPTTKPVTVTFSDLAYSWVHDYAKLEKKPGQWKQDEGQIKTHLLPVFGDVLVTELNEGHLNAARVEMLKKGLRPKSVRNVLALAKGILGRAMASQDGRPAIVTANPFDKVKLGRVGKQPFDYWMPDERDVFLEQCWRKDPEFARLVTVAIHTGMRRGELAGLRRCDIDLDRRQIRVGRVFNFLAWQEVESTKNDDTEFIPMNQVVFDVLKCKRFLKPSALIFDWCLAESIVKLRKYAAEFGVKPIRFHDLRHSFASHLVMAGVPLNTVRALLRQRTEAMVLRYAHLAPKYLHDSVDVLCGVVAVECGPSVGHDSDKGRKLLEGQLESWWRVSDSNLKGA